MRRHNKNWKFIFTLRSTQLNLSTLYNEHIVHVYFKSVQISEMRVSVPNTTEDLAIEPIFRINWTKVSKKLGRWNVYKTANNIIEYATKQLCRIKTRVEDCISRCAISKSNRWRRINNVQKNILHFARQNFALFLPSWNYSSNRKQYHKRASTASHYQSSIISKFVKLKTTFYLYICNLNLVLYLSGFLRISFFHLFFLLLLLL